MYLSHSSLPYVRMLAAYVFIIIIIIILNRSLPYSFLSDSITEIYFQKNNCIAWGLLGQVS